MFNIVFKVNADRCDVSAIQNAREIKAILVFFVYLVVKIGTFRRSN